MSISEAFVRAHIDKWTKAWNSRNLAAVLAMYSDNVEFASPKIKIVMPKKTEAIAKGKEELEQYWSVALKKYQQLHFTPVTFAINSNDECFFEYVSSLNGQKERVIEKFQFSPNNGLIVKSSAFYGV